MGLNDCFMKRPHHPGDPAKMKQHMMNQLNRELGLSSGQKTQISAIMEAKHSEMEALHSEMRPRFEALRNSSEAEIRQILNPEQQKKYDILCRRMKDRWEKRKGMFGKF
jgi:Spy/CpxP family protein refolding chaperone